MKKLMTLCIIQKGSKVLLGMKKRGFGAGRWNGFGGKLMSGESMEEALKREVKEEAGIDLLSFEKFGILDFEFKGNPEILEVHIFKGGKFKGKPRETEEMKPRWFEIETIPFKEMWPDDIHWIPLFLKGQKFKGKFIFGPGDTVLEYNLEPVTLIA